MYYGLQVNQNLEMSFVMLALKQEKPGMPMQRISKEENTELFWIHLAH